MEIRNNTFLSDGIAIGLSPSRQPCLSVIVKGTFKIPAQPGGAVEPAAVQWPVVTEDEYYHGDVTGSVRIESDAVPFKPRTDVVVVGQAHAPGGDPVRQLDVSLRIGRTLREVVRVFGDRQWDFPSRMAVVPRITDPAPFVQMPLVYERAFGGMDYKASKWCASNFIGKGFIGHKSKESIDQKPLPNLEHPRNLIQSWDDQPQPVGFGFYRKDWQPRSGYVGTLEGQENGDEEFGLPSDFQFDFFNGAAPRLQVPGELNGTEKVELRHFTPEEYRQFTLPGLHPQVTVTRSSALKPLSEEVSATQSVETEAIPMRLDTLVILPDEEQFYLVWRGHTPILDPGLSLERFRDINIQMGTRNQ